MDENKNTVHREDNNDSIPESNAARRLRMTGGGEDKDPPASDTSAAPAGFFENFWYHHKWAVIIASSFVLIFAVGLLQILTHDKIDLHIMYAGPFSFNSASWNSARDALCSVPFGDEHLDPSSVELIRFTYYSPEKQDELRKEAENSEQVYIFDNSSNDNEYSGFQSEIVGGDSIICILDRSLYEDAADEGAFLTLDEIYGGSVPDNVSSLAFDACGIRFSDTKFAKFNTVFSSLPDDTVLALRKNSVLGGGRRISENSFKKHIEYFKSILSFEYPDGYEDN